MIPQRRPDQLFEAHQAETARWLGYATVDGMNAEHDAYHRALCGWLGVPSHSMACAVGREHDAKLAGLEETAVLHVQRLAVAHGTGVPK